MRLFFSTAIVVFCLVLPASAAPQAPPAAIQAIASYYPLPQLLAFLFSAGMFALALMGKPSPFAWKIGIGYLAIVTLALLMSDNFARPSKELVYIEMSGMLIGMAMIATPIFVVANLTAMMKGWNYVFVKHSVEPLIAPALRSGRSIDGKAVSKTLIANATDHDARPVYHYENQTEKARHVSGALNKSADVASARLKMEEARAAFEAAEREVDEAQRGRRSGG